MRPPFVLTRFAGAPPVALVLFAGYALVIFGWYQGNVSWWLALGAVGAALRTFSAVGKVRQYKAWAAEWGEQWNALGEPQPAPSKPAAKRKSEWKVVTVAVLLLFAIPVFKPDRHTYEGLSSALNLLWGADCLYLVWKLLVLVRRGFVRSGARSTAQRQAKAEAAPVTWLLGRASSSPSLAEAQRNLPEYVVACLREPVQQGVSRVTA